MKNAENGLKSSLNITEQTWVAGHKGVYSAVNKFSTLMYQFNVHNQAPKEKKESFSGDLVRFDDSYHAWFEKDGAECCLLNHVDGDAGPSCPKFVRSENLILSRFFAVIKACSPLGD
jgi:hypothetical protein